MNIIITGGAGYVGSHTAKMLSEVGFTPIIIDNLSTGHIWAVKWGEFCNADLSNKQQIRNIFEETNPYAVIHFAANSLVHESYTHPEKYLQENINNALNLFSVMNEFNVRNLIFSSTCAVYGIPIKIPIDEEHPKNPVSPYGESKLYIEKCINWFSEVYKFKAINLRYFNACGADLSGELGELHEPETHLIPRLLDVAMNKKDEMEINGTDYPTNDGTAVRDFIHITDISRAHIAALNMVTSLNKVMNINLGTGSGFSVREITMKIEEITGTKINTIDTPRRIGDPPVLIADISKANEILGWKPENSNLETIITSALIWHNFINDVNKRY
jgi:UDP-glucose-4-epimerase GalE